MRNNLFLFLCLMLVSCQKEENLSIWEDFLDDDSYAVLIDTISLLTSTINLDSVKTSGGGLAMVGNITDEIFGKIEVKTFFQIGSPNYEEAVLYSSAVFDSIVLELNYIRYYFGDTLPEQTIEAYALAEDLEAREDGYLYNVSDFRTQSIPLGHTSFHPRPRSGKNVNIRLSDAFGKRIFGLIVDADDLLSDQESYLKQFKGIMLTAGVHAGTCIMGFATDGGETADTSGILLRLYYHDSKPESDQQNILMDPVNSNLQFNNIQNDRSGTIMDTILSGDERLYSYQTDELTFIQGGQGIITCIEIPYLDNLLELGDNGTLIDAMLLIKPLKGSYDDPYRLPEVLNVWIGNNKNEFIQQLYNSLGETVTSTLYVDDEFDENTRYEIPVTPFLRYELNNDLNTAYTLILTLPDYQMQNSLERLVLGGRNHPEQKVKLELLYLFY
jgi:hypothetical protein